jgi:tetratricopeptide (TPR) repeat protein
MRMVLTLVAALMVAPALGSSQTEVERGIALFDQGNHTEAKAVLTPLASGNAPDARAACYLGRIALRADDAKQATEWFETAVRLEPANAEYHLWLGRAYGTRARQAGKLSQIGLAKKTKAEFEKASSLDPDNLDARSSLIDYYLGAPGMLGGSVEKARAQAAEIRRRDEYRGALADARIAEDQKNMAGADRAYQQAIRTRPDSLAARYALGNFYVRTERPDQAFAVFEEILAQKPDETGALYAIGRTGAVSGQRLDRAEAALKEFLAAPPSENTPGPAAAHWRLGMVYEKSGKKEQARQEYQQSLALDPKFEEAKKSLAKLK